MKDEPRIPAGARLILDERPAAAPAPKSGHWNLAESLIEQLHERERQEQMRKSRLPGETLTHRRMREGGPIPVPGQTPGPAVTRRRPDLDAAAQQPRSRWVRDGFEPQGGKVVSLKVNGREILGKLYDWNLDTGGCKVDTHEGRFHTALADLRPLPKAELDQHSEAQEQREQEERNEEWRRQQRMAKSEPAAADRDEQLVKSCGAAATAAPTLRGFAAVEALVEALEKGEQPSEPAAPPEPSRRWWWDR